MNEVTYFIGGIRHDIVDGVVRSIVPKNGVARHWHANGTLARELTLVNGIADGVVREWHDNGKLACEMTYKKGKIDGTVKQWSTKGVLLGEYKLSNGWGISKKWNDDGSLALELEMIVEGSFRAKMYDDRGRAREGFLWNGRPISKKKFAEKLERYRDEV